MSNTQIRYILIAGIIIYLVWSTLNSKRTDDIEKDFEKLNKQAIASSLLNLFALYYLIFRQ